MKILSILLMLLLSTTSFANHQQELEDYLLNFDTAVTQITPLGGITLNRHQYQPYQAVKMITPEAMMAMQYWGIQMTMPGAMDLWSQIYFIGDFFHSNTFTNITPTEVSNELSLDNYTKGLRYKQTRSIDLGIGYSRNVDSPLGTVAGIPMGMDQQMLDMMQDMMNDMMNNRQPQQPPEMSPAMQWIMDLRLQAMVGVSPIIGSTLTADRFVESKSAVANLPKLQIPQTKADLALMHKGDLISYNTRGGILFNAALALALPQAPAIALGVGVDYFAQGKWTIDILKLEENKVLATINKANLQSFKLLTFMSAHQLLTLSLEKERFKEVSHKLAFIFDLNDPEVERLYQEFIRGNIKPTQERIYNEGNSGIVSISSTRLLGKIKSRNIKLTHFIRASWSKGYLNSFSTKKLLTNNTISKVHATIYLKGKESRFFSRRKKLQNNFLAFTETREKDGQITKNSYSGEFIFSYQNNKTTYRKLQKTINKIAYQTGLQEQLAVTLPNYRHLGASSLELKIKLPKQTTDFLLAISDSKLGNKTVTNLVNKFLKSNEQNGDRLNICPVEDGDHFSKQSCLRRFSKNTMRTTKRTLALLKQMKTLIVNGKRELFTKSYAQFGELLLNNTLVFQTYFQLIKEKGLQLNYQIMGDRLSYFEKELTYQPAQ